MFDYMLMIMVICIHSLIINTCICSFPSPQVALFRLAITPKAGGELFASTSMVSCIDLLENEYAMSLDVLILGNSGEERPYIVVGTGWLTSQGEDSMPKGRLLIYEVRLFSRGYSSSISPIPED